MRLPRIHKARAGFTLIELLVVIGLILVLVGITVSISYSGLIDGYKTVGAGDRASGWLLISKSKATREGAPRGVRFIIGPDGRYITEAQYIEVPDPFVPRVVDLNAKLLILHDYNSVSMATTKKVYVMGNTLNLLNQLDNNVGSGDTLSIPDFGTLHLVTGFKPVTQILINGVPVDVREIDVGIPALLPNLGAATSSTYPSPIQPTYSTTNFAFIRKARPMLGEPLLQLTGDNAIDSLLCGGQYELNTTENTIDVLFAPNGEVLNTTRGKTILWIRNKSFFQGLVLPATRADLEQAGQMSLIVIYTKTGAIATQPVTLTGTDPFAATKDGFNTGL